MSGGHYEGAQYRLGEVADNIKEDLRGYRDDVEDGVPRTKTLIRLRETYDLTRIAKVMIERADYLMSGDDGELDFASRIKEDLTALKPASPNGEIILGLLVGSTKAKKPPLKRKFTPPTEQEVVDYLQEILPDIERQIAAGYLPKRYFFDVDSFLAYYETRNWCLGSGVKMSNWKGAIRTWISNERRRHTGG